MSSSIPLATIVLMSQLPLVEQSVLRSPESRSPVSVQTPPTAPPVAASILARWLAVSARWPLSVELRLTVLPLG